MVTTCSTVKGFIDQDRRRSGWRAAAREVEIFLPGLQPSDIWEKPSFLFCQPQLLHTKSAGVSAEAVWATGPQVEPTLDAFLSFISIIISLGALTFSSYGLVPPRSSGEEVGPSEGARVQLASLIPSLITLVKPEATSKWLSNTCHCTFSLYFCRSALVYWRIEANRFYLYVAPKRICYYLVVNCNNFYLRF